MRLFRVLLSCTVACHLASCVAVLVQEGPKKAPQKQVRGVPVAIGNPRSDPLKPEIQRDVVGKIIGANKAVPVPGKGVPVPGMVPADRAVVTGSAVPAASRAESKKVVKEVAKEVVGAANVDAQAVKKTSIAPSDASANEWLDWMKYRHNQAAVKHASAMARNRKQPTRMNIVISIVKGEELPGWARRIMDGTLVSPGSSSLSMVIYVKMDNLKDDEEEEVERGPRHVRIAIPSYGHNEYAYIHHMWKRYDNLADVELFIKTNAVPNEIVGSMLDVANEGYYPYNSHPWVTSRRILVIRCDDQWAGHWLHKRVCNNITNGNEGWTSGVDGDLTDENGWTITFKSGLGIPHEDLFKKTIGKSRLPIVTEVYGEGIFSVSHDMVHRYPQAFYRKMIEEMRMFKRDNRTEHDGCLISLIPLLYQNEYGDFPEWSVSPSILLYRDTTSVREGAVRRKWMDEMDALHAAARSTAWPTPLLPLVVLTGLLLQLCS